MDPNQILQGGIQLAKEYAPEVAAVVGAFRFTDIIKAMLGNATNEVASTIQDRVRLYRFGRQLSMLKKAEKMAKDAGFTPNAVPIKLLFPLLEGASLEDDESLHDMWAALLANAANPAESGEVRLAYAAILNELTSEDAKLISFFCDEALLQNRRRTAEGYYSNEALGSLYLGNAPDLRSVFCGTVGNFNQTSYNVSVDNLLRLRLLSAYPNDSIVAPAVTNDLTIVREHMTLLVTSLAVQFIRACRTPPALRKL